MQFTANTNYAFLALFISHKHPEGKRPISRDGFMLPPYAPWEHNLELDVYTLHCDREVRGKGEFDGSPQPGWLFTADKAVEGVTQWGYNYPLASQGWNENIRAEIQCPTERIKDWVAADHLSFIVEAGAQIKRLLRGAQELEESTMEFKDEKAAMLRKHVHEEVVPLLEKNGWTVSIEPRFYDRGQHHLEEAAEWERKLREFKSDVEFTDETLIDTATRIGWPQVDTMRGVAGYSVIPVARGVSIEHKGFPKVKVVRA